MPKTLLDSQIPLATVFPMPAPTNPCLTAGCGRKTMLGHIRAHMQDILKRMVTELHKACFKPNGFKKTGGSFRRTDGLARQTLKFSSSRWNSANSPVQFSIYIWLEFTDITYDVGSPYSGLPLSTYIAHLCTLVPEAPPFFELTAAN